MIEIQLFYENPGYISDPSFSPELDKRDGEVVKVSRMPCLGEFFEMETNGKAETFVVIEVVHYVRRSTEEPHELNGDVVLRKALRR